MSRIDQVVEILKEARAQGISDKMLRKHCIPLIVERVGMTEAGASTYLNNAKNIVDGKVQNKPARAVDNVPHVPVISSGIDPDTLPVYSVVTLKDDKAVYVSNWFDKDAAVAEGRQTGRKVLKGVQAIGQPFGVVLKGTA
jgi:hypothetical protein